MDSKFALSRPERMWGETKTDSQIMNANRLGDAVEYLNGLMESGAVSQDDVDYSALINQGLDHGAYSETIEGLLYDRDQKIDANPNLSRYRNDATAERARAYIAEEAQKAEQERKTRKALTSVDFDQDEGVFTWAGNRYNSIRDLQIDLSKAKRAGILDDAMLSVLQNRLERYGFGLLWSLNA